MFAAATAVVVVPVVAATITLEGPDFDPDPDAEAEELVEEFWRDSTMNSPAVLLLSYTLLPTPIVMPSMPPPLPTLPPNMSGCSSSSCALMSSAEQLLRRPLSLSTEAARLRG